MIDKSRPILVADDDEYFRLAIVGLLRGPLGFKTVIETGSLDAALERLSAAPDAISLALFDLSMPGMDGAGTLGAVRDCYPNVRIGVVSASQDRRDVLTALDVGAHGYIPKGFGPGELVRALGIMIGGDIFVPSFLADTKRSAGGPRFDRGRSGSPTAEPFIRPIFAQDDPSVDRPAANISPRQRDVLGLIVRGYSNKQIANELVLGEGTVKIHVAALLRCLGVANRAGAAAAGVRLLRS
jgi:DNA-binding NarL/FixJ family response regulator